MSETAVRHKHKWPSLRLNRTRDPVIGSPTCFYYVDQPPPQKKMVKIRPTGQLMPISQRRIHRHNWQMPEFFFLPSCYNRDPDVLSELHHNHLPVKRKPCAQIPNRTKSKGLFLFGHVHLLVKRQECLFVTWQVFQAPWQQHSTFPTWMASTKERFSPWVWICARKQFWRMY